MLSNYPATLEITARWEGGNVDDPHDPGGRTSRGVTQRTYDAYRDRKGKPRRDVYSMSTIEYHDIFKTQYWDVLNCDLIPIGVDTNVFDGGINSGPAQSAKWVQRTVGASADGHIGNLTLGAINQHCKTPDATITVIRGYGNARLSALRNLSTFWRFGPGWENRCADVQVKSVQMVLDAAGVAQGPRLDREAAIAEADAAADRAKANGARAGAATSVPVGGGGIADAAANAGHSPTVWLIVAVVVAVVGVAVWLSYRRRNKAKSILSKAFKDAAQAATA